MQSLTLYMHALHHDGMIKLHSKVQGQSFFSVMINTAIIEIHMRSILTSESMSIILRYFNLIIPRMHSKHNVISLFTFRNIKVLE